MIPSSPPCPTTSTAERFSVVRRHIDEATRAAGRDPGGVILTAACKTQAAEAIDAALAVDQRVFGENRVQEAQGRWIARRPDLPDLCLRLIGPLQTNKAEDAVALFDVIETLDRVKLARALADAIQKTGRSPRLLVQVNTGAEPQKGGVLPDALPALLKTAREFGLTVSGLMVIPPAEDPPEAHFALLAAAAGTHGLTELSMGMSGDYETAIRRGATHVRIGSALFGERNPRSAPSTD